MVKTFNFFKMKRAIIKILPERACTGVRTTIIINITIFGPNNGYIDI